MNGANVAYFGNFGLVFITKEIEKFIGNQNNTRNSKRIQTDYSVMCVYFCIGFIDFMP